MDAEQLVEVHRAASTITRAQFTFLVRRYGVDDRFRDGWGNHNATHNLRVAWQAARGAARLVEAGGGAAGGSALVGDLAAGLRGQAPDVRSPEPVPAELQTERDRAGIDLHGAVVLPKADGARATPRPSVSKDSRLTK
jgi:hypothetical protein